MDSIPFFIAAVVLYFTTAILGRVADSTWRNRRINPPLSFWILIVLAFVSGVFAFIAVMTGVLKLFF